jgi:hypothetical protein
MLSIRAAYGQEKIFVGNLTPTTTYNDFREALSKYKNCKIVLPTQFVVVLILLIFVLFFYIFLFFYFSTMREVKIIL